MQEKDDKPKRGRKPVAAPATKSAKAEKPAPSKEEAAPRARKPIAKKAVANEGENQSIDDKASKIAAQLFGDESAASTPAPSGTPSKNSPITTSTPPEKGAHSAENSTFLIFILGVLVLFTGVFIYRRSK